MKFRRPAEDPLEINLTPLIDCLLFLIIFFMLSTTFMRPSKLQISLPEAGGEPAASTARTVEVTVSAGGAYAVNGQVLASRQANSLRSAIEKVSQGSHDVPFIISADGNTPHQAVVTVMDVAGQMGFQSLSIATRQPEAAK
ncbi:MAG TPA: biopolymer transporter ExbD [Moraxellaceae bacterium]|nr:biopolymer transporter ExbD [Moraxellaceae bacterium]